MMATKKNPFAGYKEPKRESKAAEKREPKALKAYEKKMGMDKPMPKKKK
jgi:hypothetical protein